MTIQEASNSEYNIKTMLFSAIHALGIPFTTHSESTQTGSTNQSPQLPPASLSSFNA